MLYVSNLPVTAKVPLGHDPKSLRVRFVANRLVFERVLFRLLPFFFVPVPIHQYSILIFSYVLPLPEGKMREAWKPR